MSDSLRDQLKQAGFVEKTPKPRPKKKPNTKHKKSGAAAKQAAVEEAAKKAEAEKTARKAQKAKISDIIEKTQIKKFEGDSVYSYTLDKKIRQIHVTDEARTKLIAGDWVITRLNGSTYLIPDENGKAILEINSQWLVVSSKDDDSSTDEYNDFPVPDDLQW